MSQQPAKSPVTCHVLDASLGKPAPGVQVHLTEFTSTAEPLIIASGETDADGRCTRLSPPTFALVSGRHYKLTFLVKPYFASTDRACFYPLVEITFEVQNTSEHYHIPLLISPYSYTTYRGS